MDEDLLSDPALKPLAGPAGEVRLRNVVLKGRIGVGGMGAIYLGHHEKLDIDVAVKVMSRGGAGDAVAIERFLLEARAAAKIDHSSLVRVLDVDEEETPSGGVHYIVMEYVPGRDTGRLVMENGPFEESRALEIARAVADALRAAHEKNIVHRDVKPENILIREEDGAVKLADLGLAKAPRGPDSERLTATDQVFGTPVYMSPEQIESASTVDARADIYSLGATLYRLLSGERPFAGENVFAVIRNVCDGNCEDIARAAPGVSTGACELVRRMMRPRPAERPPSMAEVVGEIDRLLRGASGRPTAAFAPREEPADVRRLEQDAMKAEAMGDYPSALKKYRQILKAKRLVRVERRVEEIEGMLPLWRAQETARAALPRGKWRVEEPFVDFARGLAASQRRLMRVGIPSFEVEWEKETRNVLARVACDGDAMVAGYLNGRIERAGPDGQVLWDARPSRKPLRSLAVCRAGGLVAAGYADGRLAFLRLSDGRKTASARGHRQALKEVAFLESAGLRTLLSLDEGGVMKRWHPSGRELGELARGLDGATGFSTTTAVACRGEEAVCWPPPWKLRRPLVRLPGLVSALALDRTCALLVLALESGELSICSTAAREELWRVHALDCEPRGVFFEGERALVAWSADEARSWELPAALSESLTGLAP